MYEKKRIKQICEITPNICKVFSLKNKKSLKKLLTFHAKYIILTYVNDYKKIIV